jgi:histidine ammonia-lyase
VPVVVTGSDLTLEELVRVARDGETVVLAETARGAMAAARAAVERLVAAGNRVYGVTTGVGVRKAVDAVDHDRVVLRQHRTPHPPLASPDVVRGATLRLVNALATGTTAVRPEIAQLYVDALNADALPPLSIGGLIGIGDLSPLAELAVALLDGVPLAQGEMIGLINQSAVAVALAGLALVDAEALLDALDVALALDAEALPANRSVLDPLVEQVRPYPGLRTTLPRLRSLLAGGEELPTALQDAASFRSAAHVHGAARDALAFARGQVAIELNAHHANPLVDAAVPRVLHVGNWELLPVATAVDLVRIALAPAVTIAGERTLKLLQSSKTGLPEALAVRPGLAESALQEHAISLQPLVGEARLLAQPVSFEVVSSTGAEGIEDRMTLLPLGARRLAEMVALGRRITAVSLLASAQACDLRGHRLGAGTGRAHAAVRAVARFMGEREDLPDLEPLVALVASGGLVAAADGREATARRAFRPGDGHAAGA